jgi:hypothetical protein
MQLLSFLLLISCFLAKENNLCSVTVSCFFTPYFNPWIISSDQDNYDSYRICHRHGME